MGTKMKLTKLIELVIILLKVSWPVWMFEYDSLNLVEHARLAYKNKSVEKVFKK